MSVEAFILAIKNVSVAHKHTKELLEFSAKAVAKGIKKNIELGRNAPANLPSDSPTWVAGTEMTPLAAATLAIRESEGITSTRPFYATGYTHKHIGPWLAEATQVRVGGTTPKARDCIMLNYGTEFMGGEILRIRENLGSRYKKKDIPPRNPIGYTRETADAIFRMWRKAMQCDNETKAVMKLEILP
jgi:hypothetical protein